MPTIKQLKLNNNSFYPLTIGDAVILTGGSTVTDRLEYIRQNYETYQDLVDNLDIEYSVSNKQIVLKLDDVVLSTINSDNFAISGVINLASYNSETGILSLSFTDGSNVNINLNDVLASILESYTEEVQSLRELHTSLSESAYEALREKDSNVYYYTYEDDYEQDVNNNEETGD